MGGGQRTPLNTLKTLLADDPAASEGGIEILRTLLGRLQRRLESQLHWGREFLDRPRGSRERLVDRHGRLLESLKLIDGLADRTHRRCVEALEREPLRGDCLEGA